MPISAIITADIVKSTLLTGKAQRILQDRIISILEPYKVEFYRGDSFQALIKNPKEALTVVLQIRAEARTFSFMHDVRASIGIGEVNWHLKKLNTATDEAFVLSGRAFDSLAKSDSRLIIQSSNEVANPGLRIIGYFVDYIFSNLTEKQSEVVFELLNSRTQLEAAKKLKKSQSTINKHTQSSGWHEIVRLLNEYDILVSNLLYGHTVAD